MATGTGVNFFDSTKGGSGQLFNTQTSATSPLPSFSMSPAPGSSAAPAGTVPPATSSQVGWPAGTTGPGGQSPYINFGKGGWGIQSPIDPQLTQELMSWLQSQVGQGASPFNLSSALPTGGQTQPGQLTAPLNPLMQQLMQFFTTGQPGNIPGAATLEQMSKTGDPISALPEWNAMLDAMQRNIGKGATNLKEQFGFAGNLASSPMSSAMTDYYTQTSKDQNSLLAQLQQQALESAEARKLNAAGGLETQAGQFGNLTQGMDQASVDRMLQEFIRTRPEYSPLLNLMFGGSTTFPPTMHQPTGAGAGGALAANSAQLAKILSQIDWSKVMGDGSGGGMNLQFGGRAIGQGGTGSGNTAGVGWSGGDYGDAGWAGGAGGWSGGTWG